MPHINIIIQIYEIQTPDEAEAMINLGVDHIGSVLLQKEKWKMPGIKDTINLIRKSSSKSSLIPLFNNKDSVVRVIEYYQPHIIHFCDDLTKNDIDTLLNLQLEVKKRFSEIKIMRSIPIIEAGHDNNIDTFKFAKDFEDSSDYFLIDTILIDSKLNTIFSEPVECSFGITGKVCDWTVAAELVKKSTIPVILAGGISPNNVRDAIEKVKPYGIDSCSMTNACDANGKPIRFKKDVEKVRRLISACRLGIC